MILFNVKILVQCVNDTLFTLRLAHVYTNLIIWTKNRSQMNKLLETDTDLEYSVCFEIHLSKELNGFFMIENT